jgi:hypothetical protein
MHAKTDLGSRQQEAANFHSVARGFLAEPLLKPVTAMPYLFFTHAVKFGIDPLWRVAIQSA